MHTLFLSVIAAIFCLKPSYETNEIDDINVFVQTVLASANRYALGLPDKPPVQRYTPVLNGSLSPNLQKYLETLVNVSSAIDKQTMVEMLWDDSIVIDNDQDPYQLFEQHRGHSYNDKLNTVQSPLSVVRKDKAFYEAYDESQEDV